MLGSLHETSLADVWNGPAVTALRTAHATGVGLPAICVACTDARTPEQRDAVVRCVGLPEDVTDLVELLDEYPRHLLFDLRAGA